jgi:hypothetical protein
MAREPRAELPVQRRPGRRDPDEERQLQEPELRHRPGEAHGGHVAKRQLAALDHRGQLARRAPEVQDAADQLEGDLIAQRLPQHLAEPPARLIVN